VQPFISQCFPSQQVYYNAVVGKASQLGRKSTERNKKFMLKSFLGEYERYKPDERKATLTQAAIATR
jgi:hypothetical protein